MGDGYCVVPSELNEGLLGYSSNGQQTFSGCLAA